MIIALIIIKERFDAQRIVGVALEGHKKNAVEVQDLAEEVEMTERSVRRVITDLRTKRSTDAYFDPKSGRISFGTELGKAPDTPTRRQASFCHLCGASLHPGARFCVNCGANVE